MPRTNAALLVVDVQNDFCPGGALAVPNGDRVVPILNRCLAEAARHGVRVYASRDWHPAVSDHFAASGGPWPRHCVQNTWGAAFHPDLQLPPSTVVITKGDDPHAHGYSVFEGHTDLSRSLLEDLQAHGIEELYVGGLATDYCVRASVLDALREGFAVTVLEDGIRGVEVQPGDSARAIEEMRAAGAELR
jgi:nicotinamidase/pyrazinamidase